MKNTPSKNTDQNPPSAIEAYKKAREQLIKTPTPIAVQIAKSIEQAVEQDNPSFIDQAVIICQQNKVNFPEYLQELIAEAAICRLFQINTQWNTPKRQAAARVQGVHEAIYRDILNLRHFCDLTLNKAAKLATAKLSITHADFTKKQSTIEKNYEKWVKTTEAQELINHFPTAYPNGWNDQEQAHYISSFPQELSKALKGERR